MIHNLKSTKSLEGGEIVVHCFYDTTSVSPNYVLLASRSRNVNLVLTRPELILFNPRELLTFVSDREVNFVFLAPTSVLLTVIELIKSSNYQLMTLLA